MRRRCLGSAAPNVPGYAAGSLRWSDAQRRQTGRVRRYQRRSSRCRSQEQRPVLEPVVKDDDNRPQLDVLIVTGIFPPDIGGPATYVPEISSELVKRGHKVTVVTLSDRLDHNDRSYSFRVHRIQRSLFKPLRVLITVMRIFREGRHAQVLYVNGLYLEAVVANFFLCKPLVQKIVGDWAWERATNKGWVKDTFEEFQKRGYGLKVEFLKSLRSFCVRRTDAVIVPSQYLASAVTHWGVPDTKTIVVYNAVELPSLACSTIPLSTRFKIVTVGRLVPWKQLDHLIEAVNECEDAGLVIVGDGPERGRLEALRGSVNWPIGFILPGKEAKRRRLL
ncbi:MAG: glycosyltransferase family 4 protein [Deltaproteobacteria bacterium]|nr:MAG: glycosyltransferase family 4 protein [Deltaproteobacteria bacterium]